MILIPAEHTREVQLEPAIVVAMVGVEKGIDEGMFRMRGKDIGFPGAVEAHEIVISWVAARKGKL
jgi:hypothetical protein